jgi:hypothetical protein
MVGKRCKEDCELLGFPVYGTIKRGNMKNLEENTFEKGKSNDIRMRYVKSWNRGRECENRKTRNPKISLG